MNDKIRISFEITDTFNRQDFRDLLKLILSEPEGVCSKNSNDFELFIISNNDSTAYIMSVASIINSWFPGTVLFDSSNTIIVPFVQDKINAIQSNNIDIHFDSDQFVVMKVEELGMEAVLVRSLQDRFNVRQQYVTDFLNILKNVISVKEGQ